MIDAKVDKQASKVSISYGDANIFDLLTELMTINLYSIYKFADKDEKAAFELYDIFIDVMKETKEELEKEGFGKSLGVKK